MPAVVKNDGRREPFDRSKIVSGLKKACEKRPISTATIETVT
ncbi:MAG: ATP cone domain-containing protein, partial [Nitrospira sp.]